MENMPTLTLANAFLEEAAEMNPGPWVQHSRYVAEGMRILAEVANKYALKKRKGFSLLDPERAYIFGLLHDIGRREGVHGMRHVLDGYRFLESQGYPPAGRSSLVHSFPDKNLVIGASGWDGTAEEQDFVLQYIAATEYNLYDRLVQLCDCVCMPHGYVLMEKRMVDVALRYGQKTDSSFKLLAQRWQAFIDLRTLIDQAVGGSIYDHLPGVVENTFGNAAD